jgi:prepilin-type processing-associated H-X9-DG protein
LFADYLRAAPIYKCPADRSRITMGGQALPRLRDYALNAYFAWETPADDDKTSSTCYTFHKASDFAFADSSKLYTFVDTAPLNICYSAFVLFMGNTGWLWHRPSIEHDDFSTLAFADGHVEVHRWRDPDMLRYARDGGNGDGNHFAFINPTSPDMLWLQEHATVRK